MSKIKFENIQCIKQGEIDLVKNKLNIKLGYNGFGKSSIAKGLELKINGEDMDVLAPYAGGTPSIILAESFTSCIVFNEEFVNNYLFAENEIDSNCFDIILHDKISEESFHKIELKTNDLKKSIGKSLNKMIEDFSLIGANIRYKETGALAFHGQSVVGKGFKYGGDVFVRGGVASLSKYTSMFSMGESPKWVKWFMEGKNYIQSNKCPYCMSNLEEHFLDNYADKITELFTDVDFGKNNKAKETILKLADYAPASDKSNIIQINTKSSVDPSDVAKTKLIHDTLQKEITKIQLIENIEKLSFNKRIDKKEIESTLNSCLLDVKYFKSVNTDLQKEAENVNRCITNLKTAIDDYVDVLEEFNSFLVGSIESSNKIINNTLKIAGIPYEFNISKDDDNHPIATIKSIETKLPVNEIKNHLSFGEKNALSLIIFGFLAKKQNNDLVILDDPVSSFDENKKYALMYYLFNKTNGFLKDETCLYLTHDIEPIIDFCFAKKNLIEPVISHFYIDGAIVKDRAITKTDIVSSIIYERDLINSSTEQLFKIIHLRKFCELSGISHSEPIYEVLSNAEKLRPTMEDRNGHLLDVSTQTTGLSEINKYIPGFNYSSFAGLYSDSKLISLYEDTHINNLEKLFVARILVSKYETICNLDNTIFNFLTKQYHIENMFIYCIRDVYTIPKYIFAILDEAIKNIKTHLRIA